MRQRLKSTISFGYPLLIGWAILCISVFIFFPGSVSFVQWSSLANWRILPDALARLSPLPFVLNFISAFLGLATFSIACISFGLFVATMIGLPNELRLPTLLSILARFSTFFLLGQAFFSMIFLTFSTLYQLTPLLVATILLIGFILGLIQFKNIVPILSFLPEQRFTLEEKVYSRIFRLSVAILFLTLFQSTARISYDASAIYFSDAKLTAIERSTRFFTNETFVASVFQSSIQYTALIQLFGDQAARMFSWLCGVVIIVFSLALGEKIGLSKQARAISLALLISSTAFLDLMGDGKVDLITSAPAIATVYWMVQYQRQITNRTGLFLIGFLIGLAVVGRPFNAFLLGVFCTVFFFHETILSNGSNAARLRAFLTSMVWIAIGAVGLVAYHLFANWMILDNPFAFLSSISSINPVSGPWDANPKHIGTLRLLYPFVATFRNNPQSLGNISPLVIALLPALLLADVRRKVKLPKELSSLTIISLITLILWISLFFTVVELRYVLFLWIILFLAIAEVVTKALKIGDFTFQKLMRGAIVSLLIFIAFRTVFIAISTYSPQDEQGNPVCYEYSFCEYLKPINESASLGDRVLTLGAYRYYLRFDLFSCSTTHEEYDVLQEFSHKDPDAFWREVYRRGYKFIAYENDYTTRHLQFGLVPDPREVPSWMNLEPIFGEPDDLIVAYQINVTNPPIVPTTSCQKSERGIWHLVTTPL